MNDPAEQPSGDRKAARRARWSLNPLARKRWSRFRRHRRGYGSLILIIAMYAVSLGSELVCNDKPLFVRFEGRSYFPVFTFYPDDVFTGSGLQTRPDYKALRESDTFRTDESNRMVFPIFEHGPYEIINPEALREHERLRLILRPESRVASVNVDGDLRITRSRSGELFLGNPLPDRLDSVWPVSETLVNAVTQRLENEAADEWRSTVTNLAGDAVAELHIRANTPRRSAPRDVRITFRDVGAGASTSLALTFLRDGSPDRSSRPLWNRFSLDLQESISNAVKDALARKPASLAINFNDTAYTGTFRLEEITWPFRPVPGHWFGIDNAGRDVLARILYGLRTSMNFGLLLVALSMGLGVLMGALQGYYGGKTDLVGQRLIEIWSTIPFLYVMILLGSMYGRSFSLLLFCYALFNWIGISYYVRAEFLKLRNTPFVDAARCLGIGPARIMFRHILPNALTPIITFLPFSLVGAIGSLAILDFLGFGLPPPTPSWGELLQQAQAFRWAWWLILYPSAALFVVILLVVFIGEGVRDAYDPKPVTRMK